MQQQETTSFLKNPDNFLFIIAILLLFSSHNIIYAWSTCTFRTNSDFSYFNTERVKNASPLKLVNDWQQLGLSGAPSARHSFAFAYDNAASSAVIHGGIEDYNVSNDLWLYDAIKSKWTQKVAPVQKRYGHMFANIGKGKFLLFGGGDSYSQKYYGDTWTYDMNNDSWEEKKYSISPSSRTYFSMCAAGNSRVYLFGGMDKSDYFNDLWYYDINNDRWVKIETVGNIPGPRQGQGMAYDSKNNSILVFGGRDYSYENLNDMWVYDISANQWKTPVPPADCPSKRSYFGFSYIPALNRTLLFGGLPLNNETWLYNSEINTWIKSVPDTYPPPREKLTSVTMNGSSALIFGGFNEFRSLQDMWKYTAFSSGTFESTAIYDKNNCPAKWKYFSSDTALPQSTSIYFQIAHSDNGTNWSSFCGQNGTTDTFYAGTGFHEISSVHDYHKYLKIKGYLLTDIPPQGPEVGELKVIYNLLPSPPALVYPGNNSDINRLKPGFLWNKSFDYDNDLPLSYRILVADNISFNNPATDRNYIFESTGIPYVTYTPQKNMNEGKWYWKVASNDIDIGLFSDIYSFNIDTTPPAGIRNVTAENDIIENGSVDIKWLSPGNNGGTGNIINGKYRIRYTPLNPVNTEEEWAQVPAENERTGDYFGRPGEEESISLKSLDNSTTYYIAVKIQDSAGNTSPVSENNPSVFTNAPPVVTMTRPSISGTVNTY